MHNAPHINDMQVWVETGDIVLVSLREYEDDKGDIIHKYFTGEAAHLVRVGEIPDSGTCTQRLGQWRL